MAWQNMSSWEQATKHTDLFHASGQMVIIFKQFRYTAGMTKSSDMN